LTEWVDDAGMALSYRRRSAGAEAFIYRDNGTSRRQEGVDSTFQEQRHSAT